MLKKTRCCRVPTRRVTIDAPPDIGEKAERAIRQLGKYQAACIWCAYGYDEYSRKAADEHFAYNCPDAPQELRDNAKRRLLLGDEVEHDESAEEKDGDAETR
jgi:hypothetical protein